jgi:hypothetical protein
VHAPPHVAVRERGEGGLAGGQHHRDQVAVETAALRRRGRRGDRVRGQPVQLGDVGDVHGRVVGLGQQLAAELGGQRGQLGVQLAQALLLGGAEAGAGAHGVAVVALQQPVGLGVEAELVADLEEGLDAGEQGRVEGDGVVVRRQLRCDVGLDPPDAVGAARAHQREEHRRHALQGPPGALQRDDRVLERGRSGVGGDRLDLRALLGHPGLERPGEVLLADRGEVGVAEGQRARGEERVRAHGPSIGRVP